MNYGEKYNAALERASKLRVQNPFDTVGQMVEHIFPELQESEGEKVRKWLIDWARAVNWSGQFTITKEQVIAWLEKQREPFGDNIITRDDGILQAISIGLTDAKKDLGWSDFGGLPIEEIQEWLEKQSEQEPYGQRKECEDCQFNYAGKCKGFCQMKRNEQKPADNVEPKFHIGEWLQYRNAKPFFVEEITKQGYVNGDSCLPFEWEDEIHLWTIQDAKCGDVLISSNKQPFVYNGNYTSDSLGRGRLGAYFGLNYHGELLITDSHGNNWSDLTGVQPATEEQRNMLFKKLHDSDYKWDSEKKELWHKYL